MYPGALVPTAVISSVWRVKLVHPYCAGSSGAVLCKLRSGTVKADCCRGSFCSHWNTPHL